MSSRLRKKSSFVSSGSGVVSKQRSRHLEESNLPIPLVLFTSYIAAEKSDKLIKVFCKELPSILKKINDSKKALENKTKSVSRLKEDIMLDLKKLELANIVLKELYKEEEVSKLHLEKEIEMLHSQIATCENTKKVMNKALIYYSRSKEALDSVAVESSQYCSAGDLIHSYLTLDAMNEKFISDEYELAASSKSSKSDDVELQHLLLRHKYAVMVREKQLESLLNECQVLKNINSDILHSISDIENYRMQEHLTRLQIKRWAYDVCQKLSTYKENPLSMEDFFKLLSEIQEFIVFSRQIISKLEQTSS